MKCQAGPERSYGPAQISIQSGQTGPDANVRCKFTESLKVGNNSIIA